MNPSSNPGTAHAAGAMMDGAQDALRPAAAALSNSMNALRSNASPALHELAADAEARALSRLRAARDRALEMRDTGVAYARGHPMQSLALAAAAGAGLMLVLGLIAGRKRPH